MSDVTGTTPFMATPFDRGSKAPCLVPVPEGAHYRVASPAASVLVTSELARELRSVLDRFAEESGFTPRNPAAVEFRPGIFGHHQLGRAADIYAVEGLGIADWKVWWDCAMRAAARSRPRQAAILRNRQFMRNLGWRLYKALQLYGRWAQPYGYPIQLFGPWTREEGPWRHISDRLLHAHRDHIHVAK